ncbi:MAG: family 4 glycosyl hydrolase [Planctomycetota bacterium]|jgi:alpha-galactosidase
MSGPKVVVIGAGSYFFGKPVIKKMATSPVMAGGTLALVDTNPKVLRTMMRLARRICGQTKCGVKVVADVDRKKVMKDADFVVLTFAEKNAHYRGVDTQIALKHGITMCSSDTIGPGGIFRGLREVPHAVAMAKDAARLCPNAWVINFVNPTAVIGMALRRFAPEVRTFALCDGHHEPYFSAGVAVQAGIVQRDPKGPFGLPTLPEDVARKFQVKVAGVNHFTWIVGCEYDGKDMMPALHREINQRAAEEGKRAQTDSKARFNDAYTKQLFDIFGIYPDCMGHTKEYVPYYQGHGVKPVKPEMLHPFDAVQRQKGMDAAWAKTEKFASGKLSKAQFMKDTFEDHASDIMESMWGDLRKPFFINTYNDGAVTNLPNDAFLELRCDVDMPGPRPQPVGPMPRGVLGLQHVVLDVHEMTAEAAMTGDKALLRRAMMTDPLCTNIPDADACIKDLLAAEKSALPSYWYKKRRRK